MQPTNFSDHKFDQVFLPEPVQDEAAPFDNGWHFNFEEHAPISQSLTINQQPAESTDLLNNLHHMVVIMETRLEKKMDSILAKLDNFAIKSFKRKRTPQNRCQALNRKGETCNGYICKGKSKHLCYAHYVIITKKLEESKYLYKIKN
jgi:hypothetical protein